MSVGERVPNVIVFSADSSRRAAWNCAKCEKLTGCGDNCVDGEHGPVDQVRPATGRV